MNGGDDLYLFVLKIYIVKLYDPVMGYFKTNISLSLAQNPKCKSTDRCHRHS